MNVVDELIRNAQNLEQKRIQDRAERILQMKDRNAQALQEALGDAWEELRPYCQLISSSGDERELTQTWEINASHPGSPLKLAPFYAVTIDRHYLGAPIVEFRLSPNGSKVNLALPDLLAHCRREYPQYVEEMLKIRTSPLEQKLREFDGALSRKEAQEIVTRLEEIWPARKNDWAQLFSNWLDRFEQHQRELAQARQEQEKRDGELKKFRADWADYTRRREEVVERNRAKLEALQAALDTPYTVQKLTYALVAGASEDGEKYASTKDAWVEAGAGAPESISCHFKVARRGYVEGRLFFHPVTLGDPVELKPTHNHITAGAIRVEEADTVLYYAPGIENVRAQIDDLGLEPLPIAPAPPGWMDSWTIHQITGG